MTLARIAPSWEAPFEELGLGEPEIIEVEFRDAAEAEKVLELARYANVHTRKPLTDLELKFIASYPEIARQVMTVTP